jgi:hypothetical protein
MKYTTQSATIVGAMCGHLWVEGMAGYPHSFDVRRRAARFSDPAGFSFRDVLLAELIECGGDFQDARFSADTELVVVRVRDDGPGRRSYHERRIPIIELPDCDDLVHADTFASDFYGYDE